MLFTAQNLYKQYGSQAVLEDVCLSVDSGQVLGLLGQNGIGKSTTMQIISGCLNPDQGEIRLDGHDLLSEPVQYKQKLGYLPEHPPVYAEMKVNKFLQYIAQLRQIPSAQINQQIERCLTLCVLEDVLHKPIKHLSKGYQQRLGIAQAIIHQPKLVVLDEPTVGLDPKQLEQTRELIKELASDGAVILSTHILSEVEACCDRVTILHQGKVACDEALSNIESLANTFSELTC